jgi:hypothetical protein
MLVGAAMISAAMISTSEVRGQAVTAFSRKKTPGQWWNVYALLSPDELSQMLGRIPNLRIFTSKREVPLSHPGTVTLEEYTDYYRNYLDALMAGRMRDDSTIPKVCASLTLDATVMRPDTWRDPALKFFRADKPVVNVEGLHVYYSDSVNRVSMNPFGPQQPDYFGLKFAHYNVGTWCLHESELDDVSRFPNITVIEKITDWVTSHSKPCKIVVKGKEQSVGVRLGKQTLRWVNELAWLGRYKITVKTGRLPAADRSWLTPAVLQLSRTISTERKFNLLPILADALEDAGCNDREILQHCRLRGKHGRVCWVVNLLLGKN